MDGCTSVVVTLHKQQHTQGINIVAIIYCDTIYNILLELIDYYLELTASYD